MSTTARRLAVWTASFAGALALSGCGYNQFQTLDEQVKAGWSEVLNQYQRRADLIPNIVATVKGEADFEQGTLTRVIASQIFPSIRPATSLPGFRGCPVDGR